MPINKLFEELDEWIKTGRTAEARVRFQEIALQDIPRSHRIAYSEMARRLYLGNLALKALSPYVRPTGKKGLVATENEKVEYAAALTRVGAVDEALSIFKSVQVRENNSVLLLQSYALFAKWDYKAAIPSLRKYVQLDVLGDYQRLVGEVNLAAALVYEGATDAQATLERILSNAQSKGNRFLYGYALQLSAENFIRQKKWEEAREPLTECRKILQGTDSLECLFSRKWDLILELYSEKKKQCVKQLEELKLEALQKRHWETPRSVDYHVAVALKDESLMNRLLYGTPFSSFKAKLKSEMGDKSVAEEYSWALNEPSEASYLFSLQKMEKGKGGIKEGSTLHRLVEVLTSDFYRPFRTAEIHSRLFPGEYFNVETSPHRVAQTVNRLRRTWESANSPMQVNEENGEYRLACKKSCVVKLFQEVRKVQDGNEIQFEKLTSSFGINAFTVSEVEQALSIPNWTAKRLLQWGVKENRLIRTGKGKSTTYQVGQAQGKTAA